MNFRASLYLFLFSFIFVEGIKAQDNIDSFLNMLHNAEARSRLVLAAPLKLYDSAAKKRFGHTIERFLCPPSDVAISKCHRYPKYLMISKLVGLLNDSTRDWYADLLLYQLTHSSTLDIIGCNSREEWLTVRNDTTATHKEIDIGKWSKYLCDLPPQTAKW